MRPSLRIYGTSFEVRSGSNPNGLPPFVFQQNDDNKRIESQEIESGELTGSVEDQMMGVHEYLEKYVRSVPGGAIAWERSIFSHSGKWNPAELIDAAVDIAWETFTSESSLERPGLDIHRAGNYFVIKPLRVTDGDFLELASALSAA